MSEEASTEPARIVENDIARGMIPGAAFAFGRARALDFAATGVLSGEVDLGPASVDTWYDLASLTKVIVGATLLARAGLRGLALDAPLAEFLPEAKGCALAKVSPLELAAHTAGLEPLSPLRTWNLSREEALLRAIDVPITRTRGEVLYSDQGFIALTLLLERIYEDRLDRVAERELFAPFGLELSYSPDPLRTAPTERDPVRGDPGAAGCVRGLVHDENTFALDGVSAHAGLFGTVRGVAGFVEALLANQVLPEEGLQLLCKELGHGTLDRRGLGWVLAHSGWSGGDLAPLTAMGHTGFTGTGLWFDPPSGQVAILLTNRVHPSRETDSGIIPLRRAFGNAVWRQTL